MHTFINLESHKHNLYIIVFHCFNFYIKIVLLHKTKTLEVIVSHEIILLKMLHLFQIGFSQLQNELRLFYRLSSAIYKLSSTVGEFTLG